MRFTLVKIISLVGLLTFSAVSYGVLPDVVQGRPLPSLAPMLERAMPAVVNISTSTKINMMDHPLLRDPFFRHFFEIPERNRQQRSQSLGSGVIVDRVTGYVLTNNHVIDKADEIVVTLQDGRQLAAKLVGTDPDSDVAVIQIQAKNLSELSVADSSDLRVGDFVVAIGNPFGLGQTVTSGIISALRRSGLGIEGYEDFIQTDASINPGNSGGALVNLRGELIGINTAIIAPGGGNVGIGFAIPSNMVLQIMDSLVKHGEVRRGLLGISVQDLTADLAQAFELDNNSGAVISRVQAATPAARVGLQPGDIIVEINGRAIKKAAEVHNAIGLMRIGEAIELKVIRNGQIISRTAQIANPEVVGVDGSRIHPTLAGTLLSMPAGGRIKGVLFNEIGRSSYPWALGLRPGDLIVGVNNYRVRDLDELQSIASRLQVLLIRVQRDEETFIVQLQ